MLCCIGVIYMYRDYNMLFIICKIDLNTGLKDYSPGFCIVC